MSRGTPCCDHPLRHQRRPTVGSRQREQQIADEARRWTSRLNVPEFYLRIFDDRSRAAYSKDLAQAGVDRPPWQTLEAILRPAAGVSPSARYAERWQGRQMCVRKECPMADHGASQPELNSVFDAQLGSSDVLHEGGHSLPRTSTKKACATASPAASFFMTRELFEGLNQVKGRDLRRAQGA